MSMQPFKDIHSEKLRARLAPPDHAETNTGVLVLPPVSGLAGNLSKVLTQLAEAGFFALAWDPYSAHDAGIDEKEKTRIANTVQQDALVVNEHKHWVGYMEKELGLARIGAIGFCMGGRMSLLLAAQDPRIAAVVAYYPTMRDPKPALVVDPVPLMGKVTCPVQVHYPGRDVLTPHANFQRLRAALEARESGLTSTYFHPHAGHGFLSRAGEKGHPDAAASTFAWPATVSFLKAALSA
jgi:carboxymethylenebutenolidase